MPADRREEAWLQWDGGPASAGAWLVAVGFAGLLGIAVLRAATGRPEWLLAWRVAAAFLLFAGLVMAGRHLASAGSTDGDATRPAWGLLAVRLALVAILLVVVYRSRTPGIGIGVHRSAETVAIVGALVALCVVADDPRRYTVAQWLVVACFATVTVIYFHHSLSVVERSVASRHPLWASVVMGVCLVVLPQSLPREAFLWALSRVAAAVVVLGLATYAVGEYSLLEVQFRYHGAFGVPLVGWEVTAIRSLFVNRNALAMVVLAGLVGSIAELDRARTREHADLSLAVAKGLVAVNAVGLVAAFGRALWVIGVMALGIYGAVVLFGRPALPRAVAGGVAYLLGGLLAVYLAVRAGVLASDPSDRFHLWAASVELLVDRPSLLGHGTASPATHILPYRDSETAVSPHNSYLSVWIRTGVVGGLAYAGIVVTSLVAGVRRYRVVDVAVLTLAVAFAAHQVFESYTMLWWTTGSVYASLAIGFLAFGGPRAGSPVA